ncbi:hypothetical protein Dimus_004749 [Dionaea muscipula]
MRPLSLKLFTDFNVGATGIGSGRRVHGLWDTEAAGTRKRWLSVDGGELGVKTCRIVACSSDRNGGDGPSSSPISNSGTGSSSVPGSSFVSRSQTYALLKQQMEVAAKSEDYKEAARIRDSLRSFEEEEPILHLRRLLKEAIANERFEDAAKYRDELKEISPHALLKCSSDATTLGIRVQVRSVYIEGRSQPSKGVYFFAYRIRITNNSSLPVQLLRRHWIITDANGKTENVWLVFSLL